jgi:hypothetical protein
MRRAGGSGLRPSPRVAVNATRVPSEASGIVPRGKHSDIERHHRADVVWRSYKRSQRPVIELDRDRFGNHKDSERGACAKEGKHGAMGSYSCIVGSHSGKIVLLFMNLATAVGVTVSRLLFLHDRQRVVLRAPDTSFFYMKKLPDVYKHQDLRCDRLPVN